MANSIDPDEMPHSVTSHLGLHCLHRPVYLNIKDKYGKCNVAGFLPICLVSVCTLG